MKNQLTLLLAMGALAAAGCGRSGLDGLGQMQLHDALGNPGPSFDLSACPAQTGIDLAAACTIDSNGKVYPEDGTLFIEAAAPPYAAFYRLRPGFEPAAADLAVSGAAAPVTAFAAPDDVARTPCCPEDDVANLVPARIESISGEGLLVTVTEAVPAGDQLAFVLSDGALFKSQLAPCTLPDASFCANADHTGFSMRFYVGQAPAEAATPPGGHSGGTPGGAATLPGR